MLKFLFKSTLYVYFIKKYKSKIVSLFTFIVILIVTTLLYSDIIEYMTINELKQQIAYLLIVKWMVYLIATYKIYLNIKSIFIGDTEDEKVVYKQIQEDEKYLQSIVETKIEELYNQVKDKPTLKTTADKIYEKYSK